MLETEFKYFRNHASELINKYKNKYVVIQNQNVAAVFNSLINAYKYAFEEFTIGTFLVKHCSANELNMI